MSDERNAGRRTATMLKFRGHVVGSQEVGLLQDSETEPRSMYWTRCHGSLCL